MGWKGWLILRGAAELVLLFIQCPTARRCLQQCIYATPQLEGQTSLSFSLLLNRTSHRECPSAGTPLAPNGLLQSPTPNLSPGLYHCPKAICYNNPLQFPGDPYHTSLPRFQIILCGCLKNDQEAYF